MQKVEPQWREHYHYHLVFPFRVGLELFVSGDSEFEIQIVPYCMGIGEQTEIQLPIVGVRVRLTAHFAPHVLDLTPMQSYFCCLDSAPVEVRWYVQLDYAEDAGNTQ